MQPDASGRTSGGIPHHTLTRDRGLTCQWERASRFSSTKYMCCVPARGSKMWCYSVTFASPSVDLQWPGPGWSLLEQIV
jgi:hypothetical protein